MTHLYGNPQTEKEVIRKIGMGIQKLEDVNVLLDNLKKTLILKEKDFFKNLPNIIKREKKKLSDYYTEIKDIESNWNNKINALRRSLKQKKFCIIKNWKLYYIFSLPFLYSAIIIEKNLLKPIALSGVKNKISKQKIVIERYEKEPKIIFQELETELFDNIKNIEDVLSSSEYSGACGEAKVLNELKKLNNNYHVFCDLRINMPHYITYNGEKNLQSAQIDFVVVGRSGVFVIEVKNWSSKFIHDGPRKFTPHEQVDREGLLMYILLKNLLNNKPRVTKILVSLQSNISYLQEYKYVFVKNVMNLNYFIQKQQEYYSSEDVNKIISFFKSDYVET